MTYQYDLRGNITRLTHAGQTQSYHYNSNDLLSSVTGAVSRTFSYDSAGRVTDNGHLSFAYNAADQMIAAGTEQYQYDAHGHRLTKPSGNTNRLTIYNRDGQLLMTRQHGQNTYKVLLDQDTVAQTGAGGTRYFHHDALGSVVAESSASGQLKRQHYRPFGLPVDAYNSPNEQGYTGHVHDDTGLVYMQARYYDPVIGRFYSNDPVDALGHMGRGNPVHGFGRYTYANNNPYKYTDPDGEFGIQIAATLIGAVIGGTTELLTNENASFSSVARASAVGGAVGLASSLGGGVISSALLGGGANAAGEAANQIATGDIDATKVMTAGAAGLVGGALAKGTANAVKGALTKGLPDNSISQAGHNATQSTSQRILSNSQSLTNAGSKSAATETQVGAGYAAGSAAGVAAAEKVCDQSSGC